MASSSCLVVKLLVLTFLLSLSCSASRSITSGAGNPQEQQQQLLRYHKGALLRGKIAVNLIWYGKFTPSQRAIVADFITSVSDPSGNQQSVGAWWRTVEKYYHLAGRPNSLSIRLGRQILDEDYSLGKSLSDKHIVQLASRGDHSNSVNVILTASDVTVNGFCLNRCGTHGSSSPTYGPQSPPLVPPNNDVGLDGIVMSLSGLLAGTATNPFGNGYYQGSAEAPLEAASACPGVYGKGAYPGYAGDLLVDPTTGASYNAHGANGRKYLLPAIYDPTTSKCSTLF
ncbi:Protein EXORDIUM [Striga hermonthica]|uniref:Protein EXORDIUM n=1 Tax=Striga hermonthica TaxID=68872 RepID=A0A9N7RR40_STRHE|nr:Protein EXORDIUM [Striga hermonthica]